MRRWRVVVRVKHYPTATSAELASLSPALLLRPVVLGDVVSDEGRTFTRWGARLRARRLNALESVMCEAVVERAS